MIFRKGIVRSFFIVYCFIEANDSFKSWYKYILFIFLTLDYGNNIQRLAHNKTALKLTEELKVPFEWHRKRNT